MLALNEEKFRPVTEMILKGVEKLNDKVMRKSTEPQETRVIADAGVTMAGKTAGNSIPPCVCNGRPAARNIDTLATVEAPTAVVNPGTRHATTELGAAAADGAERRRIRGPLGGVNADETVTLEAFKFEQVVAAAALLKAAKRMPVTETVVKVKPAGTANETVKVTFWLTRAWCACWLRISASLRARS
jgi:hypothetical protein